MDEIAMLVLTSYLALSGVIATVLVIVLLMKLLEMLWSSKNGHALKRLLKIVLSHNPWDFDIPAWNEAEQSCNK